MNTRVSVTEMARNFSEFINRVAYRGERFTLTRGGRPVGELHPALLARPLRELPSLLESLPHLSDEEAAAFAADLDAARRELDGQAIEDRWAS